MKTGKVVLGLLAGVAAGAILGILLAPDKGSNTRKKIMSKGEGYVDDVKEKFNEAIDAINDKYKSIRHGAEDLVADGKMKFEDAKNEVKKATL
ncbi:YtxH domain-containing protein [Ferruginibacter profundus]